MNRTLLLTTILLATNQSARSQPAARTEGVPQKKHPGMVASYPVVRATSCSGHGVAVAATNVSTTRTTTNRLVTRAAWGCGCPTGPVFTLAYVPRSSPLEVRLCLDASKDTCERGCGMPIEWNLDAPLSEAKTTSITVVQ